MKHTIISVIALFFTISSCKKKCDIIQEKWTVQNNSNHIVEIKSYDLGKLQFSTTINPNESELLPYEGGVEDVTKSLGIRFNDSTLVVFDGVKKMQSTTELQIPDLYDVTDCEKRNRCCTRTFYITEEHYLQADSL